MKNMKKAIALLMCILSLCSVISVSAFAANSPSKPSRVVASSVKQTSLKLRWTSSSGANFYRVFVKSKGKWKAIKDVTSTSYNVTGLSAATTYNFAVKSGKKQSGRVYLSDSYATVKVKTKTLAASKLVASADEKSVKLKWSKLSGAKGYSVYQKKSGSWKIIANLSSSKNSFTVKNLKSSTSYQFAVRGICTSNGKKTYGPASNIVKVKTSVSNKVVLTGSVLSSHSVKLQWTKAPSATGYRVYRYINGGWETETTVNSAKTLSVIVDGLSSDKKYSFRVRAFRKSGSNVKWYDVSDTCSVVTDPDNNNLKLYRTENLRKTLSSEKFTLSYTAYNDKYIKIPVTVARSGKKYYLSAKVDEMPYTLLNISSGNFIVLNDRKAYIKVPNVLAGTVDIKDAVSDLLPDDNFSGEVSVETFNGKKAICEAYTSFLGTETFKYYYKAGSLVGIEELDSDGKTVEKIVVSSLSKSAKDSLFAVPSGYQKIAYSAR